MEIKNLFEKNIEREINGVVKVGTSTESVLFQELDEFVVTQELTKHFRTFYNNYNTSFEEPTSKVGVWISGDFGSGKSHFLKMLSYLLENKEVSGKKTIDFFQDKFDDIAFFGDIKKITKFPTETILFNIADISSTESRERENGIVEVFLNEFNKKCGYSSTFPRLAKIERFLNKEGKYEKFKELVMQKTNLPWQEVTEEIEFRKDAFIDAYKELMDCRIETAIDEFKDVVENYEITPQNFAKLIKEYLNSKDNKNARIIFLVDEVSQFISDNGYLMLCLQTIVEQLGIACNGKAWVIVTAQKEIDTLTKKFNSRDYSKIQGRFDTKLSLSGSNIDEVIQRRLLKKKNELKPTLEQMYKVREQGLANILTFSSDTSGMKTYDNSDEFVSCYPVIPYQFNLLQKTYKGLKDSDTTGAHISTNERSMLQAFHNSLKKYKDKPIKELIPFNSFYETVEEEIDPWTKQRINNAKVGNPDVDDFDVEVLKVLFLMRYAEGIPCNIENITTLMITNVDEAKNTLKNKIETALNHLKKANLIQQDGEIYNFLTNVEQEINGKIKNTIMDDDDTLQKIYSVLTTEIYTKSNVTLPGSTPIPFIVKVDNKTSGSQNADIEIQVVTSLNPLYCYEDPKMSFIANNILYIKLKDENIKDNNYIEEIETWFKTDKFLKQNSGIDEDIRNSKGKEQSRRERRIQDLLEQAICDATFYTASEVMNLNAGNASAKLEEALKIVANNSFSKLSDISKHVMSDKDIYTRFSSRQMLLGNDPNAKALNQIKYYLQECENRNDVATMQTLKNIFTKRPFGWQMNDIAGLVADLACNSELIVNYNGMNIDPPGDVSIIRYLTNDKEISKTCIKIKKQIDSEKVQKITRLVKDIFDTNNLEEDGDKLAIQIKDNFIGNLINNLNSLKANYSNNWNYPDKDIIEQGIADFTKLIDEPDANKLFNNLLEKEKDLREWFDKYKRVKAFFSNQQQLFDEATDISKQMQANQNHLGLIKSDQTSKLNKLVEDINTILHLQTPELYSRIKDLAPLKADIEDIYSKIVLDYKKEIGKKINKYAQFILDEANKMQLDSSIYATAYDENITKKYEQTNDLSQLNGLAQFAEGYYIDLVNKISNDAQINNQTKEQEENTSNTEQTIVEKPVIKELDIVAPADVCDIQFLETEEDVDNYINKLSQELKSKIKANKRIKLK